MPIHIRALSLLGILLFGLFGSFGHEHDPTSHFHLKTRGVVRPHHSHRH